MDFAINVVSLFINYLECEKRGGKSNEKRWMALYNRLVLYKAEHDGSTEVPNRYTPDRSLGIWVKIQLTEPSQWI